METKRGYHRTAGVLGSGSKGKGILQETPLINLGQVGRNLWLESAAGFEPQSYSSEKL